MLENEQFFDDDEIQVRIFSFEIFAYEIQNILVALSAHGFIFFASQVHKMKVSTS